MSEVYTKGKTIYLDMDGVFCDFVEGLLISHGRFDLIDRYRNHEFPKDWMMEDELGDDKELWKPVDEDGFGFWMNLNPYPEMEDIIEVVKSTGIPWYICTTPRNTSDSYAGKIDWIKRWLGDDFDKVIMCKVKSKLANPNTMLIDDNDENCLKFRKAGGNTFLYPQSWNTNSGLIQHRLGYLEQALYHFRNMPRVETYTYA